MKLTLENLQTITTGTVSITQEDGWFIFRRFAQPPKVYFPDRVEFKAQVTATSSLKLDFITDARQLEFKYRATRASSRSIFFVDLYIDNALVTTHGCKDADKQIEGYFSYPLPEGEKRVTLYFPNLYNMMLQEISLAKATVLLPPEYDYTMICYGDSITQGYDAPHPSFSYANRLAFSLNASMINKGIGGDVFHPEMIDDNLTPDIVCVALGSNDWGHSEYDVFLRNSEAFMHRVLEFYPQAQVFVVTPIWRRDGKRITACGKFENIAIALKELCSKLPGVHLIEGWNQAAQVADLLTDHAHPGDLGHVLYGANLYVQFAKALTPAKKQ